MTSIIRKHLANALRPSVSLRGLCWVAVAVPGVATICAALTSVAGRYGANAYPFSLFEHFVLRYALGFAMVTAVAALIRWRSKPPRASATMLWVAVFGACANVAIAATARLSLGPAVATTRLTADATLLLANVLRSNRDSTPLCELAKQTAPDLIALVEPDQRWINDMRACLPTLHYVGVGRDDNFGIALLSRWPLACAPDVANAGAPPCVWALGSNFPTIVATVKIHDAAPATLLVTHPIPPISRELAASHLAQLDAIATQIASTCGPVIVAGDLNATPWSGAFRRLVARASLHDSRPWYAYHATWPVALGPLGIPIDNVLGNRQIVFSDRTVLPDIGSDHRPVLVRFHLQQGR